MTYVYGIGYYLLCVVVGFFVYSLIESWMHIHRWNKWQVYTQSSSSSEQTRQRRNCKTCNKTEDEHVSYSIVLTENVKWNEINKRYE